MNQLKKIATTIHLVQSSEEERSNLNYCFRKSDLCDHYSIIKNCITATNKQRMWTRRRNEKLRESKKM